MDTHDIFRKISPIFRNKRFRKFLEKVKPGPEDRILDVGGYPGTWTVHEPVGKSLDILNIHEIDFDPATKPEYHIKTVLGNACALQFADKEYDIVFSNSVIEHVGTWENQKLFAEGVRRVGKKIWLQTPARSFFIEPHYIAPFIHWFPKRIQRRLARYFTIYGLVGKPSQKAIDDQIEELRLISYKEMKELFPDCKIVRERFLLIFTKSYTAFRDWPPKD